MKRLLVACATTACAVALASSLVPSGAASSQAAAALETLVLVRDGHGARPTPETIPMPGGNHGQRP